MKCPKCDGYGFSLIVKCRYCETELTDLSKIPGGMTTPENLNALIAAGDEMAAELNSMTYQHEFPCKECDFKRMLMADWNAAKREVEGE